MHLECWLRTGLGSIAHLEGRCYCVTGVLDEDTGLSHREEGRQVMEWVQRRKRGVTDG